jgi:hypothetical protein
LGAFQQPLQSSLDVGLPAQPLLELEAHAWEVPVRSDDLKSDVAQEVCIDDAPIHRTVAEDLYR